MGRQRTLPHVLTTLRTATSDSAGRIRRSVADRRCQSSLASTQCYALHDECVAGPSRLPCREGLSTLSPCTQQAARRRIASRGIHHLQSVTQEQARPNPFRAAGQQRGFQDFIRTVSPGRSSASTSAASSDDTSSAPTVPRPQRARIPLRSGSTYGASASRGTRPYQEDTYRAAVVHVQPEELRRSYARSRSRVSQEVAKVWSDEKLEVPGVVREERDDIAGQLAWFGCFDGHGGSAISKYLRDTLHATFERVTPSMVTDTVQFTRSHGGYFRRFKGGLLERWVRDELLVPVKGGRAGAGAGRRSVKGPNGVEEASGKENAMSGTSELDVASDQTEEAAGEEPAVAVESHPDHKPLPAVVGNHKGGGTAASKTPEGQAEVERKAAEASLEEREKITKLFDPPEAVKDESLTLAERATLAWLVADRQIQADPKLNVGGSTASVVLLHSLDTPTTPWYSSKVLSITSVHVGDTRTLLCPVADGQSIPLTSYHHPDDRAESERLRKMGAGMITDSFGEARWMGALANTRAFGDTKYKQLGVTAEPEVLTQVIKGDEYAFLALFSDGINSVMSDQEVLDLCRDKAHPLDAAREILAFAEALGAEDNAEVLIVPLRGWGKVGGQDTTRGRRDLRLSKVDIFRDGRR